MKLWNSDWPTALAPMQDVTGLPFMKIIAGYGAPDLFFTEFFRVHKHSTLNDEILRSITENPSSRPIFAQVIGESIEDLCRVAKLLENHPIAGLDLNLGCPAPRVYKKNVGGGLLRDPEKIFQILSSLRENIQCLLTVKMRIGFEDDSHFEEILSILKEIGIDLLSLHSRTVLGGYRSAPDHNYVGAAVRYMPCPVLLNGNVTSAKVAVELKSSTGAAGVMVGRAAIRNPWIFRQIAELQEAKHVYRPRMEDLYEYISRLYDSLKKPDLCDTRLVARMKKFLNFIGLSVDPKGEFLHQIRRVRLPEELFSTCSSFLLKGDRCGMLMPLEPFDDLVARPSQESSYTAQCCLLQNS